MKLKVKEVLSKEEVKKVLGSEESKSSKMRLLWLGGVGIKEISIMMGVRYNFVYNVVSNLIRMSESIKEENIVKVKREGRKEEIEKLVKEGLDNVEISKELKCNYNYVWKIRKELESK